MAFDEIKRLISERGITIIAVAVIVSPVIWAVSSYVHRERLDALREQVNLLQEQNKHLERKLTQPAEFVAQSPAPSSVDQSTVEPASATTAGAPQRYPSITDPARPTKQEVRDLAKFYGLFTEWKVNPHLRFTDGDISYWQAHAPSESGLKLQFESRRIILERAEATGEVYPTQGDLSHAAQQIRPSLAR